MSYLTRLFTGCAGILMGQVLDLCNTFEQNSASPIDLFYAFRCMSIDVITCAYPDIAIVILINFDRFMFRKLGGRCPCAKL